MNKSINDEINENLALIIKKTNLFEKISELKNITCGFIFFSGFATTFILINVFYNSYLSYTQLNDLKYKIRNIESMNNILSHNLKDIQTSFDDKNNNLNKKIDILIESNNSLIEINKSIMETNLKQHICLNETINRKKLIAENSDDELLNECYDNIPCNNIKKATGLNSIFGF